MEPPALAHLELPPCALTVSATDTSSHTFAGPCEQLCLTRGPPLRWPAGHGIAYSTDRCDTILICYGRQPDASKPQTMDWRTDPAIIAEYLWGPHIKANDEVLGPRMITAKVGFIGQSATREVVGVHYTQIGLLPMQDRAVLACLTADPRLFLIDVVTLLRAVDRFRSEWGLIHQLVSPSEFLYSPVLHKTYITQFNYLVPVGEGSNQPCIQAAAFVRRMLGFVRRRFKFAPANPVVLALEQLGRTAAEVAVSMKPGLDVATASYDQLMMHLADEVVRTDPAIVTLATVARELELAILVM